MFVDVRCKHFSCHAYEFNKQIHEIFVVVQSALARLF